MANCFWFRYSWFESLRVGITASSVFRLVSVGRARQARTGLQFRLARRFVPTRSPFTLLRATGFIWHWLASSGEHVNGLFHDRLPHSPTLLILPKPLRFSLTLVMSLITIAIGRRFSLQAQPDATVRLATMISVAIAPAPANKGKKLPAEPLAPEEVKALIRSCSTRAATGVRNRALIVTLYRAGLRVGEALALLPKDLDPINSTIRILHGKGDQARTVGLDAGAWAILQLWLDRRAALGINGHCRVFSTLKGQPVKAAYVRMLLPRLARKAGITKRCHAHGLRHSFAYELAGEGTPIHLIQAQLGHSSLATTDRYVRHLCPVAVVEAMKARAWSL